MNARIHFVLAAFLLLTLIMTPASAAPLDSSAASPSYPNDWNMYVKNQFGGTSNPIALQGDAAYYSIGARLIALHATPNPGDMEQYWESDTLPGIVTDIVISANKAYVALEQGILLIYDVSSPYHPVLLGRYFCPAPLYLHTVTAVAVSGNYAYLADFHQGVRVINVSDPSKPVQVSQWHPDGWSHEIEALTISGQKLYLADNNHGLVILSVQNPALLALQGSLAMDTTYDLSDIDVEGSYAYVGQRTTLYIFNVSNPASPALAASYVQPNGYVHGVDVSGHYAYLTGSIEGLQILDVQNLSAIVLTDHQAADLGRVIYGSGVAYATIQSGGIFAADVLAPDNIGDYDESPAYISDTTAIALDGDYLYFHDVKNLVTYPTAWLYPHESAVRMPTSVHYHITAEDGEVYISSNNDITAVHHDTTARSLTLRGSDSIVEDVRDMQALDGLLFVAGKNNGLRIYDPTDASNLVEVGRYVTMGTPYGVAVTKRRVGLTFTRWAFVADGSNGLCVIDVTDETTPLLKYGTCLDTPETAYSVEGYSPAIGITSGLFAYVANGSGGLCTFTLSGTTPTSECNHDGYNALLVKRSGSRLYTVDNFGVLHWYSLADPAQPKEVGRILVPGGINGVAPGVNGTVYVTTADGGVAVIEPTKNNYLPITSK